jgi:putative CocE/NonD family hydrolase
VGGRWRQEIQSFAALNDLLQIWSTNDCYLAEITWDDQSVEEILADARRQIGPCIGADEKLARTKLQEWANPYGNKFPYYTTRIPVLHWQNWYDPGLAPEGMKDWRHFQSIPSSQGLHYLRVGSADHGGYKLCDVGRGDEANPYVNRAALEALIEEESAERADFFDEHLNGVKPVTPRPRARWHVGHVGWQETDQYPPQGRSRVFRLNPTAGPIHALIDGESTREQDLSWIHDPTDPVPSSVDMEALWYFCAAYPDERAYAEREDVLTFRTQPLEENLDFAGQPVLTGEFSFTGPSTHVHVKLQDVHPDGTTRRISQGRAVLSAETGGRLRLALDDNAYRIKQGHSLQLQIMSSDCPHFVVHPGTNDNPYYVKERVSTTQGLHVGGPDGARLEILTITLAD